MTGWMWVGSQNRRVPRKSGKSACMEPSQSLSTCWASVTQIKVAITKFGSTSSTSMLGWLIENHGTKNFVDKIRERGSHLTTTAIKV